MRNYFYDCEFLEGSQKVRIFGIPLFGLKTKPTIDMISIGMVSEGGRSYYAISSDFNLREAWNRWQPRTGCGDRNYYFPKEYWIRENVLRPIYGDLAVQATMDPKYPFKIPTKFTYRNLKKLISWYGISNEKIAEDLQSFVDQIDEESISLYGYYSAYDHVALCWLFGKMIDLPDHFPRYTKDLKQILDEKNEKYAEDLKKDPLYPKQVKGHHVAVDDAKWNLDLYEFLETC